MNSIASRAFALLRRTDGQAAPEYAVVLSLVAVSSATLLAELGGRVTAVVQQVAGLLH
jgi:Flp pilus assembly pilin Flp